MADWQLGDGSISLMNLSHLGIAVNDAESTAQFFSSVWGIGTPEVIDYEPTDAEITVGNAFAVRLVFIKFGPLAIELLQPLDDKSIWSSFIKEKGEGIHHIALGVSNYDEQVGKLKEQGHPMLVEAALDGCRWCYFSTSPGGMVVEFREEYARS